MTEFDLRAAQPRGTNPVFLLYGVSTDVVADSLGTSKHDALCADAIA